MGEERHRDDPKASWNQPHKPKHRKNTRLWCRGKEGVPHEPEVRLEAWASSREGVSCRWYVFARTERHVYLCYHVEVCVNCGKKLRSLRDGGCPDWVMPTI